MLAKTARARRFRQFLFSPLFKLLGLVSVIGLIIYLIFFTNLIKKNRFDHQIAIIDPSPELNLHLISYQLESASQSAQFFLNESRQVNNPPFQVLTLNKQGQVTENQSVSTTGIVPVLVDQNLPDQTSLKNIYSLFHLLPETGLTYSKLWVAPARFCVIFDPAMLVLFPLTADPQVSFNTLQQIRSQSKMNLESSIIDLRFDKPVVSLFE